jgi:hypothetical protein
VVQVVAVRFGQDPLLAARAYPVRVTTAGRVPHLLPRTVGAVAAVVVHLPLAPREPHPVTAALELIQAFPAAVWVMAVVAVVVVGQT